MRMCGAPATYRHFKTRCFSGERCGCSCVVMTAWFTGSRPETRLNWRASAHRSAKKTPSVAYLLGGTWSATAASVDDRVWSVDGSRSLLTPAKITLTEPNQRQSRLPNADHFQAFSSRLYVSSCYPTSLWKPWLLALWRRKTAVNHHHHHHFMKLFSTSNIEIVISCQEFFGFELPSTLLSKRIAKFESMYYNPWLLMMNSVTLLPCRKLI